MYIQIHVFVSDIDFLFDYRRFQAARHSDIRASTKIVTVLRFSALLRQSFLDISLSNYVKKIDNEWTCMSRRFDKHTEIFRTISTFRCRPFERSRCLDHRRRFRDRWGKMIDSRKKKTSPNRLRIWTPSFFEFQVIPDGRFSSKYDDSTTQFLTRCLLHTLWSSVSIVYRIKLQARSHEQRVHVILRLFSIRRKRMCRVSAKKLRAISTASFLWWLRHKLYSTSTRFHYCRSWSSSGVPSCFALDATLSYTFRKFCWWVLLVYQAISFLLKDLTFHRHQFRCSVELKSIATLTFWREGWWSLQSSRLCVGRRVYRVAQFSRSLVTIQRRSSDSDLSERLLAFSFERAWRTSHLTCVYELLQYLVRFCWWLCVPKERRQHRNSYICSRSGSDVS